MRNIITFLLFVFSSLITIVLVNIYLRTDSNLIVVNSLISLVLIAILSFIYLISLYISRLFNFLLFIKKHKTDQKIVVKEKKETIDLERRQLLKLIGTLGFSTFLFSLFKRNVGAIQFGGTGNPDPIGIEPLGGTQTTGAVTLTNADTWYQVPTTNQTNRVFLNLNNRSGYDMYWSFDNTVNVSTGGMLFPNGGNLMLDAGNAVNVYVRCGTAGQACWYSESQTQ